MFFYAKTLGLNSFLSSFWPLGVKLLPKGREAQWMVAILKHYVPAENIIGDIDLQAKHMGLLFKNPMGLAAGFDADADAVLALSSFGFGHMELGPKISYKLRANLEHLRKREKLSIVLGLNLFLKNANKFIIEYANIIDYFSINIFTKNNNENNLYELAEFLNKNKIKNPLLLKLCPSIGNEEAQKLAKKAIEYGFAGLIVAGLRGAKHDHESNFEHSTDLLRCLAHDYQKDLLLIGSGGISDGPSLLAKLNAGASLVQAYSGFLYQGPKFIADLIHYLKKHQRSDSIARY